MPRNSGPNVDVKHIAVDEFGISNLPSYVAIDNNNVISNAGVGSILSDQTTVSNWMNKAFFSENKLYKEIANVPSSSKEEKKTPSSSKEEEVKDDLEASKQKSRGGEK